MPIQEEEGYSSPSTPTFSDITCAEKVCNDSIALSVGSQEVEDHVHRADVDEVQATKVVGDNLDKNVNPRYRRQGKQTLSMHFYHSYAIRDRVSISGLSDKTPDLKSTPLLSIPVINILPTRRIWFIILPFLFQGT